MSYLFPHTNLSLHIPDIQFLSASPKSRNITAQKYRSTNSETTTTKQQQQETL